MNKFQKYILSIGFAGVFLFSFIFVSAVYIENSATQDSANNAEIIDNMQRAKEMGENIKDRVNDAKEDLQNKIDERRAELQDEIKERRESLKARIGQIKDEAKKKAAEKIGNQFDRINQVWTKHFLNVLDRLDAILDKIESRRDGAFENGQDVSSVDSAISQAESAISSARLAVEIQAGKSYVVDTSSLTNSADQNSLMSHLRSKFKELRDMLFSDLRSLRDGPIKEARTAVRNAFRALVQVFDDGE